MATTTEERQPSADSDTESGRLALIRKLLSKAEATPFPEESETFMAKVSELIARWAIDEALVWANAAPEERAAPIETTILLPAPYAARKAVLVNEVAKSCGCQCVRTTGRNQIMTIIGFEGDVRRAEMLVTSLMVQLTRDMLAATPKGRSAAATSAWRRSFIIAFADRIGERLAEARAHEAAERDAEAAEDAAQVTSTALVLVDRDTEVAAAVKARFPQLRTTRVSAGRSHEGAAAGRSCANRADIGSKNLGGARAALGA